MTCVLQKPAKPGKCPEKRVQTHPPWLIRGHPGEAADWAIGHRTLCQFVVKRLASSLALSDSNEDNAGIWEKLLHSFFFTSSTFVEWSTLVYTLLNTSDKNEGDTALAGWSSSLASQHLPEKILYRWSHMKVKQRHSRVREPVWLCEEKYQTHSRKITAKVTPGNLNA